ncbi:hypothetical protein RHSIM_Rhsim02G0020200 [Rhododendron simsii]|uniref:Xylanase inhibitor C-terminal domain-containing protein n=1 Tax=Rhododendron simsii TaxID=118357 RepID=A0A834H9D5_RHOSS|nr:hypothetical protein RHSIM_Rhsim02G0020200 [Rhododendron simsii]
MVSQLFSVLVYTPLLLNPNVTAASDYYIGVKSIKINQINVPNINVSLLAIDNEGNGRTKISTRDSLRGLTNFDLQCRHRVLQEPALRGAHSGSGGTFRVVLQLDQPYQHLVSDEVLCLGFVDGGSNPRTSIVIGGYQIEDNLLQFDLGASRLGFTSSLLYSQTTCANFNFISNA